MRRRVLIATLSAGLPVLFGMVALPLGAALTSCSSLTAPPEADPPATRSSAPSPMASMAAIKERGDQLAAALAADKKPADDERVGASHILVAYKGAMRAATTVTRSKEEAKKRADDLLKKVRGGADFATLAKDSSDDPGSGPRGGALGNFTRGAMVKPFADATFALKPGETSNVVETDFGFHIIKRTQ